MSQIAPEVIEAALIALRVPIPENGPGHMEAAIRAADEARGLRMEKSRPLKEVEGWNGSLFVCGQVRQRLVSDWKPA